MRLHYLRLVLSLAACILVLAWYISCMFLCRAYALACSLHFGLPLVLLLELQRKRKPQEILVSLSPLLIGKKVISLSCLLAMGAGTHAAPFALMPLSLPHWLLLPPPGRLAGPLWRCTLFHEKVLAPRCQIHDVQCTKPFRDLDNNHTLELPRSTKVKNLNHTVMLKLLFDFYNI